VARTGVISMHANWEFDQTRFPLATLIIEADKRKIQQKARLLRLAFLVAQNRGHSL